MTLILTIGNASRVCQSSDYRLTDLNTGAPVSDGAGSKQLRASFKGLDLQLAFTGIAQVGGGSTPQRTVDWLSEGLKELPHDSQLQDICEALMRRSASKMARFKSRGVLEIVLTVATVGKPFRVATISNVDWGKRPPEAKSQFTIRIHEITKPFRLISGYRSSVPALQWHRLRALARDIDKSPNRVLDALTDINAIAAKHGRGYISKGCWVTCQFADGRVRRSASLNSGQHQGGIHLLMGGLDLMEWVKTNFQAAPGKEISIVQSAGVTQGPEDCTPLPLPTGAPRRFTLSGSSVSGVLRSPVGHQCASIDISKHECVLEIRCNEDVTVPFAKVALSGIGSIGGSFPKPLYPWPHIRPTLMIDDTPVPQGLEYSVGYWIEREAHHVTIPKSSRSVRNLAFLGPEDELVIVAPSTSMEFAWGEHEEPPSAEVHATVWWRSRLDGTRG